MIQVLPVIPEDEVVCSYVEDWPRDSAESRMYDPRDRIGYDSSCFGYVAILRDDTILLEVGRPSASLQLPVTSFSIDISVDDCDDTLCLLDTTIYGLLQPAAVPGWQAFCLPSHSSQSLWKGLRFHVYDDTLVRAKHDFTIWTFCLVYRCMGQESAQHYQEWMIRNLIQFTELFRKNDVVWQTGPTLSCQFLFAPLIEQKMHMNHSLHAPRHFRSSAPVTDQNNDICWSVVAEQIIVHNKIIVQVAADPSLPNDVLLMKQTRMSSQTPGPPFVSDESDCEDCDSNSSLGNTSLDVSEPDGILSDYDDESAKASDSILSPDRTGTFPCYCSNEDDENACLEQLAASNSVWKLVEQSRASNEFPMISMFDRNVLLSMNTKTEKSILPVILAPVPSAPSNSDADDAFSDSLDSSDEENIPLICLVGNQVGAQHSDLWKRSPKCISKAVALGLSPRPKKPIPLPTLLVEPVTKEEISMKEIEPFPSPLDIMVSAVAETFVKLWNCLSNLPDDRRNHSTDAENDDNRDGCWCRVLFKPKASALV